MPKSISICTADTNSIYLESSDLAGYAELLTQVQCKLLGSQFIEAEILYQGEEKKVVYMWFDQHFENLDKRP